MTSSNVRTVGLRAQMIDRCNAFPAKPSISMADGTTTTVRCPACSTRLKVKSAALGRKLRCPKCQGPFVAAAPTFAGQRARDAMTNGIGMKLCWCPPGSFTMGSPANETGRGNNENQVRVTLTRGFWLGKHQVTHGEWTDLIGANPWDGQVNLMHGSRFPATNVSWEEASAFCTRLTERERRAGRLPADCEYRLPTEAEWEYACRAGTRTKYSFGDDENELTKHAWFEKNAKDAGENYAHKVGSKRANPWGLCDMHGNVWEWCADFYDGRLLGGTDPPGPNHGSSRVYRGGCWGFQAAYCRSANRYWNAPSDRFRNLGFRVAASSVKE